MSTARPASSGGAGADWPALSRAVVDRAAWRRRDDAWLTAAWERADTRVLVVAGSSATAYEHVGGPALVLVAPPDAPAGERLLLGELEDVAYFAVAVPALPPPPPGAAETDLRSSGALLGDRDAGLLTHAVALAAWHERSRHCPRCGAATEPVEAGAARRCTVEGTLQHPRTDPAVIMLVHDGADRCVLGRQRGWPPGFASALAGFVEPGESAEMAVAREVAEEVGLVVDPPSVSYLGSQPWPFPASLMLGFRALAEPAELVVEEAELESAAWWSRGQMRAALQAGDLRLPPPVSIAHRLVTGWLERR